MSEEEVRTIGFICPKCRQSVIADIPVASLCRAPSSVPCPCGGSRLTIEPYDTGFNVTAPCASCHKEHKVTVPREPFLHEKAVSLSCGSTGLDCCYIGEEGPVYGAMRRLEEAIDNLDEQNIDEDGNKKKNPEKKPFLNELVMQEELEELRDIAARGGISCTCGSRKWSMNIHYASIELQCAECGGKLRIPAASQDDLTDLCCKETLLIHKHV